MLISVMGVRADRAAPGKNHDERNTNMKQFTKFLAAGVIGLFGLTATAQADIIITPATPGIILGTSLDPVAGPSNCEPGCVYQAFGLVNDGSLSLLYKADFNENEGGPPLAPTYSGSFAGSYTTAFSPGDEDPTDALIEYILGSPAIGCPSCYLAIKDGNIEPRYYFFDLSAWNGTETLDINSFWPGRGAISHVAIWGVASSTSVPEPGTIGLLGLGLLGFAAARRRKAKA